MGQDWFDLRVPIIPRRCLVDGGEDVVGETQDYFVDAQTIVCCSGQRNVAVRDLVGVGPLRMGQGRHPSPQRQVGMGAVARDAAPSCKVGGGRIGIKDGERRLGVPFDSGTQFIAKVQTRKSAVRRCHDARGVFVVGVVLVRHGGDVWHGGGAGRRIAFGRWPGNQRWSTARQHGGFNGRQSNQLLFCHGTFRTVRGLIVFEQNRQ